MARRSSAATATRRRIKRQDVGYERQGRGRAHRPSRLTTGTTEQGRRVTGYNVGIRRGKAKIQALNRTMNTPDVAVPMETIRPATRGETVRAGQALRVAQRRSGMRVGPKRTDATRAQHARSVKVASGGKAKGARRTVRRVVSKVGGLSRFNQLHPRHPNGRFRKK